MMRILLEILRLITLPENMHPWEALLLRSCITQCLVIRRQTLTIQITTQFVCIRDSGMHRIKITFNELYGYTQDIYENAYSCADLMEVIKVYNTDTTPEALKVLTEAYTVEDVEKRIEEN